MQAGTTEEKVKQEQRLKTMTDMLRKIKAKSRMDANKSWWVSELLAADCKKAWLRPALDTEQQWHSWLHEMKKMDEEKRTEEEHPKLVSQMIANAEGGASLLHRITKPTVWRGGVQVLEEEERDVRPLNRCKEKRKEWANHWQCNTEV